MTMIELRKLCITECIQPNAEINVMQLTPIAFLKVDYNDSIFTINVPRLASLKKLSLL